MACNRITADIKAAFATEKPIKAILDPYNPVGSQPTCGSNLAARWQTDPRAAISTGSCSRATGRPSSCLVADSHPRVRVYAKNHNLGLERLTGEAGTRSTWQARSRATAARA